MVRFDRGRYCGFQIQGHLSVGSTARSKDEKTHTHHSLWCSDRANRAATAAEAQEKLAGLHEGICRDSRRYRWSDQFGRRVARRLKLLLDTHIWIWSVSEPERVSRRVARAIEDARNELWVSPVSTWEIVLLSDKGRLKLRNGVEVWIQESAAQFPLREAPLTNEIALATRSIHLPHHDPGDRLLAATALTYGLTLVTADRHLANCRQIAVLWNR